MREICILVGVLATACGLQSQGPGTKFSEAVQEMNKATRWGQVAEGSRMADPTYRDRFTANHAAWGQQIQLGDSEVVSMELVPGGETATSILQYQWYLSDAMSLHQTVVRQRWTRTENNGYALISEAIIQGDPRLFAANPEAMPEPAAAKSLSNDISMLGDD